MSITPIEVEFAQGSAGLEAWPVLDQAVVDAISDLISAVQAQGSNSGGEVSLSPSTLAALESIQATITNHPTDFPDSAGFGVLQAISALLQGTLDVSTGHDQPITNAQLRAEPIPIEISGTPDVNVTHPTDFPDAGALAKLQSILTKLQGTLKIAVDGADTAVDGNNPLPVVSRLADENGVQYSDSNPLPVDVGGNIQIENLSVSYQSVVSTAQVPDHMLAANEVFVGPWEDVRDYSAISIAVKTDAGSAFNGAKLEFSSDGVNPITSQESTIPGGISAWYVVAPQARYIRVRYTNGPVAMTQLDMQVIFSFQPLSVTQAPLGGPLTDMAAVQSMKAAMVGRINSGPYTGMWTPIAIDPATGRLLTTGTALSDTELRASPINVQDDYSTAAFAPDQLGSDSVLSFVVPAGKMVMVDVDPVQADDVNNYRCRATTRGSNPSSSYGFVCRPGTSYLPVSTDGTVKVWAPVGVTVAVQVVDR